MQQIYNTNERMPTIHSEDIVKEWLSGDLTAKRIQWIGQYQFPAEHKEAYTIHKDFRSALEQITPIVTHPPSLITFHQTLILHYQ